MSSLKNTVFSPTKLLLHERVSRVFRDSEGDFDKKKLLGIYPVALEVGPSGKCNNDCDFCMHRSYYNNDREIMPLELYKKLVDEVAGYKDENERARSIVFSSSGEPTTNPRIVEFLRHTKQAGLENALITNGTALRKSGLMDAILETSTWVRISLNAGTSETRQKIHGVGSADYDRVMSSLSTLAEKRELVTDNYCQIGTQIVVTEDNCDEIGVATRRVMEAGADYLQIKPVVFHPLDGREQLPVEFWREVVRSSEEAKAQFESDGFKVFIKDSQFSEIMKPDHDREAYPECLSAFFPIIEADGKVYHCSQTRGVDSSELGNLNEQTFKEIWESDRRKAIFENIDIEECQPVCRCHPNNKILTALSKNGITDEMAEELDEIKKSGGQGPNFI